MRWSDVTCDVIKNVTGPTVKDSKKSGPDIKVSPARLGQDIGRVNSRQQHCMHHAVNYHKLYPSRGIRTLTRLTGGGGIN